ncbi:MAG: RidA family protein [Candidatus Bipolaricaulota bacterium]
MSKGPIVPPGAQPAGPYSAAYRAGELLFVSGQIPLGAGGGLVGEGIEEQTRACLDNLSRVLDAAGASPAQVVKATIFLTDMTDFQTVNAIYGEFFGDHRPARACFQVGALPKGARVEIQAIAYLGEA